MELDKKAFICRWQKGLSKRKLLSNLDLWKILVGITVFSVPLLQTPRKIRWDLDNNKGKSGGIRVIYVDFEIQQKLFLLLAYPKSQKDNLTEVEKQKIKGLVKVLAKSIYIERG